ncbi:hypothetical protein BH23ACT9_BH23ACT9_26500 [soil metagenome]
MRGAGQLTAALVLAVALQACAPAAPIDPNAPATGPLTALAVCDPPPAAAPETAGVDTALLPEDVVITGVTPVGPLVNMTAAVPRTPVTIRLEYEARDDIDVLVAEDEVFESELLVTDGRTRLYLKASAICQTGSVVVAVMAPEDSGASLPAPAGSP